ncbi:hypothetical protein HHI36_005068 [Cryptolaemus montrouzieri]|uniref:Uncharacterized protein n=1 Tax=Cryptolaemus montrouzieri TaxID=559131 RepID=A0ABD2NT25_9CUCU
MIWNLDEAACTTVTNAPKIVSQTGVERVGHFSSTNSEGGPSVFHVRTSNSADPLINPEAVGPFPKALPSKPIKKQRKGKTTIITEMPEKDILLLENMMDILNKKTAKTEKLNLKYVKQVFEGNSRNKESNKTKNNKKAKKKKTDTKKCTKASPKKEKVERKFSKNEKITPRLRNRSTTINKIVYDEQCTVCKKKYLESTEGR